MSLDPLRPALLAAIEHRFCQCALRPVIWRAFRDDPRVTPAGLCGPILLKICEEFRPDLHHKDLASWVGISESALSNFLGKAWTSRKDHWIETVRSLFELVLLGSRAKQTLRGSSDSADIANRILRFYLGSSYTEAARTNIPFFSPDVQFTNAATNMTEVAAEWRWVAAARQRKQYHDVVVSLVSGGASFMPEPTNPEDYEAYQQFTSAIEHGVQVYLFYPEPTGLRTDAERGARDLRRRVQGRRKHAPDNFHLRPLSNHRPLRLNGRKRWPVEYLSPIFSFGYVHATGPKVEAVQKLSVWRPLASHAAGFHALPEPVEKEVEAFHEWQLLAIGFRGSHSFGAT